MLWDTDPWKELDRMRQEIDGILGRTHHGISRRFPPINIYDAGDDIVVSAELPGMSKDQVNVTYSDGVLTLAGERRDPERALEGYSMLRQERPVGRFEKSFEIPTKIDPGKISARFRSGIMTINLAKAEEAKPKTIPITVA